MLKFNKPMWENLEQAVNFYCTKETESFKNSEYFLKLTQLADALGLKIECSFGFAPDNEKFIYLYFDILDSNGNGICANNDEFDALGYSVSIVSIDRKNRFKFYSWQDNEDWIDSVEWNINELEKMVKNNREVLKSVLKDYDAELISYEYYPKIFGNYMIAIKLGEQTHSFVTDRGEIYHNDKMMCDSSYHVAGCDDTFTKLLEIIKQELSGAVK